MLTKNRGAESTGIEGRVWCDCLVEAHTAKIYKTNAVGEGARGHNNTLLWAITPDHTHWASGLCSSGLWICNPSLNTWITWINALFARTLFHNVTELTLLERQWLDHGMYHEKITHSYLICPARADCALSFFPIFYPTSFTAHPPPLKHLSSSGSPEKNCIHYWLSSPRLESNS